MDIQGKIIAVLPQQSGVSQRTGNAWASQEYVIETHDQYPRKCCFRVFGADRIAQFGIKSGEELTVSFDIDSHEYNGRWFNNITAWQVQRVDPTAVAATAQGIQPQPTTSSFAAPAADTPAPFPPTQSASTEESSDDLPF